MRIQTLHYPTSLGVGSRKDQKLHGHPIIHPAGFPLQEHSVPSRTKLCHASGSEWQLCPARRPQMSPSNGHNTKSRSTSPCNQAQMISTQHSLARQCDRSQQQWPCHMPHCTQVQGPFKPCLLQAWPSFPAAHQESSAEAHFWV